MSRTIGPVTALVGSLMRSVIPGPLAARVPARMPSVSTRFCACSRASAAVPVPFLRRSRVDSSSRTCWSSRDDRSEMSSRTRTRSVWLRLVEAALVGQAGPGPRCLRRGAPRAGPRARWPGWRGACSSCAGASRRPGPRRAPGSSRSRDRRPWRTRRHPSRRPEQEPRRARRSARATVRSARVTTARAVPTSPPQSPRPWSRGEPGVAPAVGGSPGVGAASGSDDVGTSVGGASVASTTSLVSVTSAVSATSAVSVISAVPVTSAVPVASTTGSCWSAGAGAGRPFLRLPMLRP